MRHPYVRWMMVLAVAGSVSLVAAQPGRKAGKMLVDPSTKEPIIRYVLDAPSGTPPGQRLGLIVTLHGTNGNEVDALRPITAVLQQLKLKDQYVVLGLKSKDAAWAEVDDEPVRRALAWVMKEQPIDPRRVYGWGFSAGGFFWGRFGPRHPDLLAGVVLCAGGVPGLPREEQAPGSSVQVYMIACERDQKVVLSVARSGRERLEKSGYRFVYRELAGAGHNVAWAPGPGWRVRRDAMLWCHAIRGGRAALSEKDEALLRKVTEKLDANKTVSTRDLDAVSQLGSAQAADAVARACASEKGSVRAAAARAGKNVMLGPTVESALAPLLDDDKNKKVRTAAFEALGQAAHWQSQAAEDAVCALALDTQRKDNERVLAIQQLASVVPIELQCSYRNRQVLGALIDLLMDPSGTVRRHAFAALMGKGAEVPESGTIEPPSPTGFGYSPKARESSRAEAQERWRQWLRM